MSPDEKLSVKLNDLAGEIERRLHEIMGEQRVPFLLLVAPTKHVQYVANVARKDGVGLIKALLNRWQEAGSDAAADIPEHQKDRLLRKLITALRSIADYTVVSTVQPVAIARDALKDAEPTIAFYRELSDKGPMSIPAAPERH